jgi:hypothetical protein
VTGNTGYISNTGIRSLNGATNQINVSTVNSTSTISISPTPVLGNTTLSSLTLNGYMSDNITNGVSIGSSAGTAGNYNVYVGHEAGTGSIGSSNVGVGYQALASGGVNSVGLGSTSGYNAQTNGNIVIGNAAGQNILTGSGYNIYIGGTPSSSSASYETVIGTRAAGYVGMGSNTCYIPNSGGLYSYSPYVINLYNNGAPANASNYEQFILNSGAGVANIGTAPTITGGVISNIPPGVYLLNLTGSLYMNNNLYNLNIRYKTAAGVTFFTLAQDVLYSPSTSGFATVAISATVRISATTDQIVLLFSLGNIYGIAGSLPLNWTGGTYSGTLNRYLTISFISL